MKIQGIGVGGAALNGSQLSGQPQQIRAGQNQGMSLLLFGKRPPKLLHPKKLSAKQKRGLRKLALMEEQIAEAMGLPASAFEMALCEGDNACVGRDGLIRFGAGLLEEHGEDHDLLLAIVAHEMGHQPWTWPTGNLAGLSKKALQHLYREEEAKADRFAGKTLGTLGLHPASVEKFLKEVAQFESGQSPDYYPAEVRAEMLVAEWRKQSRRVRESVKFNPRALERMRELR